MAGNSLRIFGNYFVPAGYEHQHLLMQTRGSVFHGIILGIADENIHRNYDRRVYAVVPLKG